MFSSHVITLHIIVSTLFTFSSYLFPSVPQLLQPPNFPSGIITSSSTLCNSQKGYTEIVGHCSDHKWTRFCRSLTSNTRRHAAAILVPVCRDVVLLVHSRSFNIHRHNTSQINILSRTRGKTTWERTHTQKQRPVNTWAVSEVMGAFVSDDQSVREEIRETDVYSSFIIPPLWENEGSVHSHLSPYICLCVCDSKRRSMLCYRDCRNGLH